MGQADQLRHFRLVEQGGNQQDHVRPGRPRLVHLIRFEHEILAEDGTEMQPSRQTQILQ